MNRFFLRIPPQRISFRQTLFRSFSSEENNKKLKITNNRYEKNKNIVKMLFIVPTVTGFIGGATFSWLELSLYLFDNLRYMIPDSVPSVIKIPFLYGFFCSFAVSPFIILTDYISDYISDDDTS